MFYLDNAPFYCQIFEAPVTFIESKKQKTSFEDVDGSKVIGYLEKDSPGTSNNINFPDFNTFSYRGVVRYRWTGKMIMILSTRDQSMSNSSVRPQNSPYFCAGQKNAGGHRKGLEGGETGERREKCGFFILFCLRFFFCSTNHSRALRGENRENLTRVKTDGDKGLPQLFLRLLLEKIKTHT